MELTQGLSEGRASQLLSDRDGEVTEVDVLVLGGGHDGVDGGKRGGTPEGSELSLLAISTVIY